MIAAGPPSPRTPTGKRPSRGFAKGAAVGVLVVIPLISLGIWIANRLGIGEVRAPMIGILRLTVLFAGIPIVATCGGLGRLATQASRDGGRGRACWVAGRALALGGAALIVVAAIPTEVLPESRAGWAVLAIIGAIIGAIGGVAIGLVCSGEMPTLAELGVWPADGTMGRAMERVVSRAAGRRPATTEAPPDDGPDRP